MIQHRFLDELEDLENNQRFCGKNLAGAYKYLIVGTFNPDDQSCVQHNGAIWFYGRCENHFWYLLPMSLGLPSLHPVDNPDLSLNQLKILWKKFCIENRIVIIDLLKFIPEPPKQQLPDFKDISIEAAINNAGIAVCTFFNVQDAFYGVSFEKVLITRSTWDKIENIYVIKELMQKTLIRLNCINFNSQIYDLVTPSPRGGTRDQKLEKWRMILH